MKIVEPAKCEMTVERPDGTIDTVIHPNIDRCNGDLLARINAAMLDAGKGRIISYRNIDAVVEMEEPDYRGRCERCGCGIDARHAYHQKEWGRLGGSKIRVETYYCDECAAMLKAIGDGEKTAMQDRAAAQPDMTPETKTDY